MRYWIDTEFIEDGRTIDLISIGIVSEDDRQLYLLNYDADWTKANAWVQKNVLKQLPPKPLPFMWRSPEEAEKYRNGYYNKTEIARKVREFCSPQPLSARCGSDSDPPEFWADYGSYDWVAFCQLFGTMMDLPKGYPMFIMDIQQWARHLNVDPSVLPMQSSGEHDALQDAKHTMVRWQYLENIRIRTERYSLPKHPALRWAYTFFGGKLH